MKTPNRNVTRFASGSIMVEIHPDKKAAGAAGAHVAAEELRRLYRCRKQTGVIFATEASQLKMLNSLTSIPDLPWQRMQGFHMDENIGLAENDPAKLPATFLRSVHSHEPD